MSPIKSSTFTTQEIEAIEALREQLVPRGLIPERKLHSDHFLLRYLKANSFNMDKTEKMIEKYSEETKEYKFDQLADMEFPKEFSDKFMSFVGGSDREGRPIAMIPQGGLWNIKEAIQNGQEEMFIRYVLKMTSTMEKMIIERNVDCGVLVCDLSNVSYGNYFHKRTLEVLITLIRLLENCAPRLFGKVYLVNASKLACAMVSTIKRMVTLSTEINVMDSNEKKWKTCLDEIIPEEGISPHFGGSLKTSVKV